MSETWWRNQQYRSALLPEFCAAQARNAAGAIRPPFSGAQPITRSQC